ncbi:MAG: P-loop NTPase [Moorellales bacterium]
MRIAVASGKGGTGKTLVATSLALSLAAAGTEVQFADCDVDAPNAHLFLHPTVLRQEQVTVTVIRVDVDRCSFCRRCTEVCAFKAVVILSRTVVVFPELCHGCGACAYFCPEKAITEEERPVGLVEEGQAGSMTFIQGRLNLGEPLAPPIIRQVKARLRPGVTAVLDAPPGTACSVVETVKGTDFCLLVTEPTPFGLHDLELAVEVTRALGVPAGVVLNRAGVAEDAAVEDFCRQQGLPLLLKIPFDRSIAQAYARGLTLVDAYPEWQKEFLRLAEAVKLRIGGHGSAA